MTRLTCAACLSAALLLLPAAAHAQDSVAKTGGLPGDAVSPWADGTSPNGSDQCNAYLVRMNTFASSWGTRFGLAPVVKSSKASTQFFGSLFSAQAMSKRMLKDVRFASPAYRVWHGKGFGINGDPAVNDPGRLLQVRNKRGIQLAITAAEFATTDTSASYNGILGAAINRAPREPWKLWVTRTAAAINGCDDTANTSQLAVGAVDETGNVMIRADGFTSAPACGLNFLLDQNIFRVNFLARDCAVQNVISNDFPAGLFDVPATDWILRNNSVTHNTPNMMPSSVTGGAPLVLGSNFAGQFVRGPAFGSLTSDLTHFATGMSDHRGNISYTSENCAQLGSTHGVAALLGYDFNNESTIMDVFGLDAAGNPVVARALTLPAVITDNSTGFTNMAGLNEFDHYHSQVAFRGGNGQVALGVDQNFNLLVAAVADHPDDGGPTHDANYIAVAKINCTSGAESWTMAAYTDFTSGKPILDGPGGNVIGQMVPYSFVPPGSFVGPSITAPMMDSVGNIYFVSGVELFDPAGSEFYTALLRAVYDPANFSYELELLFHSRQVFTGMQSRVPYRIDFLPIADSNSIDSAAVWSGNITEDAHMGIPSGNLAPKDPRTLGGLVLTAGITYDYNKDGLFEDPTDPLGNPLSPDQVYNVLFYVGSIEPVPPLVFTPPL